MKQRSTTPVSRSFVAKASLVAAAVLMAVSGPVQMGSVARADQYDDQINAIKQQVDGYQAEANRLQGQAQTLQGTLNELNAQKSTIQAQINLNQARYDQLQQQIADTKQKIKDNQDALGETLANLYVDDNISPLEMLASSKNISEYLDKQEYRNSIRDTLTQKISEIKKLKADLDVKKADVEKVLADQKQKHKELASKEAVQQKLLADTNNDEKAYQNLIGQSQEKIKQVQAEQQAAYARARSAGGFTTTGVGGSGNYPWAGKPYPCWNAYTCADPWQLFYRECVSYVAWRLDNQGYGVRGFGGAGNANQWPGTTSSYTTESSTPHQGDALVMYSVGGDASTGHVMYVEGVNGDGSISISEYNFMGPGTYSTRTLPRSYYDNGNFTFLTFPRR